jgi:hypothetical protein
MRREAVQYAPLLKIANRHSSAFDGSVKMIFLSANNGKKSRRALSGGRYNLKHFVTAFPV